MGGHNQNIDAKSAGELLLTRGCSPFGGLLFAAYRVRALRPVIRILLRRLEGGLVFSSTWRRILRHYDQVSLGAFSYGPGLRPGVFAPGTSIGRFCSFAGGLQVLRRNHPTGWLSQHPLFFNPLFGLVKKDMRPEADSNHLRVGNDVWIGWNVTICPGCREIGDGAIIGACAVVTKDVPAYTIVVGNPARPIRKRFTPEIESLVVASKWWLRPLPELVENMDLFTGEVARESLQRFTATTMTAAISSDEDRS